MVNWEKSYIYGKRQEAKILPLILSHFGREISPSVGRFAKYDYTDKDFNYEVKSRTNKMKAYPTTMITKNKTEGSDRPVILIFNFCDCLSYIKYDEEQFKDYYCEQFSRAGIEADEKPHYYIPIDHLSVIEEY
tara:strand:+ start:175 stop:573 length:399 start_codon:yes stop_codon:yes gene_type:complete